MKIPKLIKRFIIRVVVEDIQANGQMRLALETAQPLETASLVEKSDVILSVVEDNIRNNSNSLAAKITKIR